MPETNRGLPGKDGATGAEGRAGTTGLTGETGSQGGVGITGTTGAAGAAGATGLTGVQGPVGPSSTRRLLVMFIIMMIVFGVLAWRSQVNANNIKQDAYDQCVLRNVNVDKLNALYSGIIAIERTNPFQDQGPEEKSVIEARIALYEEAKLVRAECAKP